MSIEANGPFPNPSGGTGSPQSSSSSTVNRRETLNGFKDAKNVLKRIKLAHDVPSKPVQTQQHGTKGTQGNKEAFSPSLRPQGGARGESLVSSSLPSHSSAGVSAQEGKGGRESQSNHRVYMSSEDEGSMVSQGIVKVSPNATPLPLKKTQVGASTACKKVANIAQRASGGGEVSAPPPHAKNRGSLPVVSVSSKAKVINLFEIHNLLLWILNDELARSPSWVVIGGRQRVRRVVVLLCPGLDFITSGHLVRSSPDPDASPFPLLSSLSKGGYSFEITNSSRYLLETGTSRYSATENLLYELLNPLMSKSPVIKPSKTNYGMPLKRKAEELGKVSPGIDEDLPSPEKVRALKEYLLTEEEKKALGYPSPDSEGFDSRESILNAAKGLLSPKGGTSDSKNAGVYLTKLCGGSSRVALEMLNKCNVKQLVALDCEFVQTGARPDLDGFSLARISAVDFMGQVLLDLMVKPDKPVVNYLTAHSGITAASLARATASLEDAKRALVEVMPDDCVLVGHSLDSDLNVLRFTHEKVIDTVTLFPHPKNLNRQIVDYSVKPSLQYLCEHVLHEPLDRTSGHDSIADAQATMKLALMKLGRGKDWHGHSKAKVPRALSAVTNTVVKVLVETQEFASRMRGLYPDTDVYPLDKEIPEPRRNDPSQLRSRLIFSVVEIFDKILKNINEGIKVGRTKGPCVAFKSATLGTSTEVYDLIRNGLSALDDRLLRTLHSPSLDLQPSDLVLLMSGHGDTHRLGNALVNLGRGSSNPAIPHPPQKEKEQALMAAKKSIGFLFPFHALPPSLSRGARGGGRPTTATKH